MSAPTVRAAVLHMLPDHLRAAGASAEAVFGAGGMDPAATATPRVVHRAQVSAVLNGAARVLGQPTIGLALGAAAEPVRLGAAGQALVGGQSIGSCLRAHASLMPAMQTHVRLGLALDGDRAVWSHRLDGERAGASWILYEGAAAFHLRFFRALLGPDWSPSRVLFPHACRGRLRDYEDFFRAPVSFGDSDAASFLFDREVLRHRVTPQPPPASDAESAPSGPAPQAFRLDGDVLVDMLRTLVAARLAHGAVTLTVAAAVLGVSPRTLQRRLDEAGTAFEDILDGVRRNLATTRIGAGAAVTEVAMSLGYSDAAHFTRAFRRWTGVAPTAFRARRV